MIADHECLIRVDGYRSYAVSRVEDAESDLFYPFVFEDDILVPDATGMQAEIEIKALCPAKNAFSRYKNSCCDCDSLVRLCPLCYEDGDATEGRPKSEFADRNPV